MEDLGNLEERMIIFTSEEAAQAAGLNKNRLNALVRDGKLPQPGQAAGRRYYTDAQVEEIKAVVRTGMSQDGTALRFYKKCRVAENS